MGGLIPIIANWKIKLFHWSWKLFRFNYQINALVAWINYKYNKHNNKRGNYEMKFKFKYVHNMSKYQQTKTHYLNVSESLVEYENEITRSFDDYIYQYLRGHKNDWW